MLNNNWFSLLCFPVSVYKKKIINKQICPIYIRNTRGNLVLDLDLTSRFVLDNGGHFSQKVENHCCKVPPAGLSNILQVANELQRCSIVIMRAPSLFRE